MSAIPNTVVSNGITDADINRFRRSLTLDTYQYVSTNSAIYPGQGTPLGMFYVSQNGASEASEFAGHMAKAIRDDGYGSSTNHLTSERRQLLIKEIGDELWYLAAKCNELGISLSNAALINLIKLRDRAERGVISGSGDER